MYLIITHFAKLYLVSQVEELSLALQQEKADIERWKDKWAQESAKTDGIKRECLQVTRFLLAFVTRASAPLCLAGCAGELCLIGCFCVLLLL